METIPNNIVSPVVEELDLDAEAEAARLQEEKELTEIAEFAASLPPAPVNNVLWDLQQQIAGEVRPEIDARRRAWAKLPG